MAIVEIGFGFAEARGGLQIVWLAMTSWIVYWCNRMVRRVWQKRG